MAFSLSPLSDVRFLVIFPSDLRGNPETEILRERGKRGRRREPQKWVGAALRFDRS